MQAIEITGGAGSADALVLVERPDPVAGPGQIRVRVRAAGVNRPDLLQRQGRYPAPPGVPDILGLEVAGEVDPVGEGVARRLLRAVGPWGVILPRGSWLAC